MSWDGFNRFFEYFMVAAALVGLWLWQKRSRRRTEPRTEDAGPEHAVIVTTSTRPVSLAQVIAVEDRLQATVLASGTGKLDGHDIAVDGSGATFFLYGVDADRLFASVEPVLRADPVTADGEALLRYGQAQDPHARERRVALAGR
jgi:lysylphosphatidylglycerol synthetase-like protein (DUF2156 family)